MEESDILTELSSPEPDTETETDCRRFSSASLFTPRAVDKSVNEATSLDVNRPQASSTDSDAISLNRKRDSLRIRLSSKSPKNGSLSMGKLELEASLKEAHNDLDRLVEYAFLLVEENNALKEILKGAVIVSDDGNMKDYSELLLKIDRELPILNSMHYTPFSQSASPPHTPTPTLSPPHTPTLSPSHQTPQPHKLESTPATNSVGVSTHAQSEPIIRMSMDCVAKPNVTTISPPSSIGKPQCTVTNQSEADECTVGSSAITEKDRVGVNTNNDTSSQSTSTASLHSVGSMSGSTATSTEELTAIYTVSPSQPTVAENLLEATASQSTIVDGSCTSESRAAMSIKKLHSLTITDSWKEFYANKPHEDTPGTSKWNGSASQPDSPKKSPRFSHLRRKNKEKEKEDSTITTGESLQVATPQESLTAVPDKEPSIGESCAPQESEEEGTLDMELKSQQPKFYTSDMMAVIVERNELKEKVLQLDDKIKEMEREMVRMTSEQEATDFGEVNLRQVTGFRRNTKLKNRTSLRECDRYISDVLVIGYKKISSKYVYVIHATWSDGQRFEVYRRYGDFFTFHNRLLLLFPAEAGKFKSTDRILPTLPTIDNVLSLFGRTNNESVVKQRLDTINDYCKILLLDLDCSISKNDFVVSFFRPSPGDRQLQSLARPRSKSEMSVSILSVYPQHIPAGSTFEEYLLIADYQSKAEGELSVNAGEVVKVINREATGWWLVCKVDDNGSEGEQVGYVPGDFLKRYDRPHPEIDSSVNVRKKYLGFVSSAALSERIIEEVDLILKYVAIEDYTSDDPRQISFVEGAELIVIEKSEDGWWLVTLDGKQGWAPASFLEPKDRRAFPEGEKLVVSLDEVPSVNGEEYVTKAEFRGQIEEDISFPEKATIEVIEKSISGWWMVRYKGRIGMAPASMLALTETHLNVPKEYQFALTVDLGHGASGIIEPPPRSKKFLFQSQSQRRPRSNTNTDENKVDTILEEAQFSTSSSSDSEDEEEGSSEAHHRTMGKHVRKRVITNEARKKNLRMRFKSFVRPENIKQKPFKHLSEAERRGTAPAALFKGRGRTKKLHLQGMSAFVGSPFSAPSSGDSPLVQRSRKEAAGPYRTRSVSSDDRLALMSSLPHKGQVEVSVEVNLQEHSISEPEDNARTDSHTTDGHYVFKTTGQSTGEETLGSAPLSSSGLVPAEDTMDIDHEGRETLDESRTLKKENWKEDSKESSLHIVENYFSLSNGSNEVGEVHGGSETS